MSAWTSERQALAARMHLDGKSQRAIAGALDVSVGAVAGMLHRLRQTGDLETVASNCPPTHPGGLGSRPKGPAPRSVASSKPQLADVGPHECRFPIGDPKDPGFHFCGKPAVAGKPYCAAHCAVAYQARPSPVRKGERAA